MHIKRSPSATRDKKSEGQSLSLLVRVQGMVLWFGYQLSPHTMCWRLSCYSVALLGGSGTFGVGLSWRKVTVVMSLQRTLGHQPLPLSLCFLDTVRWADCSAMCFPAWFTAPPQAYWRQDSCSRPAVSHQWSGLPSAYALSLDTMCSVLLIIRIQLNRKTAVWSLGCFQD
jgi:hypothetical protein